DEKGVPVYSATNRINCVVSGPIRLLGLEDANPNNIEDYKDSEQNAFKGRLLIYVQSIDQTGRGRIIVSSPGLKKRELTLEIY
ncbi:unnamed protein product, partial [marine sediment metagenome]